MMGVGVRAPRGFPKVLEVGPHKLGRPEGVYIDPARGPNMLNSSFPPAIPFTQNLHIVRLLFFVAVCTLTIGGTWYAGNMSSCPFQKKKYQSIGCGDFHGSCLF